MVSKLGETGFGGAGVPAYVLDTGTEACATGPKKGFEMSPNKFTTFS